jgi:hypothetical protein
LPRIERGLRRAAIFLPRRRFVEPPAIRQRWKSPRTADRTARRLLLSFHEPFMGNLRCRGARGTDRCRNQRTA